MKAIVITGCPRAGTKYVSELLQLGHEKIGERGISSWVLAAKNAKAAKHGPTLHEVLNKFEDVQIHHQVRHPISCIRSITSIGKQAWRFICENSKVDINAPVLLRAMQMWYYWNLMAEEIAETRYQVETLPKIEGLGTNSSKARLRRATDFTPKDLRALDPKLYAQILELSNKYGYV